MTFQHLVACLPTTPIVIRQIVSSLCLALAACVPQPLVHKDLTDFLIDGHTRRDQIEPKLGEPSARYESSRITAYRLSKTDDGYIVLPPRVDVRGINDWSRVQYSLILVFTEDAVLARHAFVNLRSP